MSFHPIWSTPAGSLGVFPMQIYTEVQLAASPVLPAVSLTYALLSGSLTPGLSLSTSGLLSGTPPLVLSDTTYQFGLRVTDNLGNIRDRTFSMTVSGLAVPTFTTTPGTLFTTNDSEWIEYQFTYTNPDPSNEISFRVSSGSLPAGLEMNSDGLIRGYPTPPTIDVTLSSVITTVTATNVSTVITCFSTSGFSLARPIVFTGTAFGGIVANVTYYIRSILTSTTFTISQTANGPVFPLTTASGSLTATLPSVVTGQPTVRSFPFAVKLESGLGDITNNYSITVVNQNLPIAQGGPGYGANTRVPTMLNIRPLTFNLTNSDIYYGYYILPPADSGYNDTYPPTAFVPIGTSQSQDYFAFKPLGYDFDGNPLTYVFAGLPPGLTGNTSTGWITGNPILNLPGINQYSFSVYAHKTDNPAIQTPNITFTFNLAKDLVGNIIWITPADLGTSINNTLCVKSVIAESDVDLEYRLTSGTLPANLELLPDGSLSGFIAVQPTNTLLEENDTVEFTFTVEAFSPTYTFIKSSRTFTMTVDAQFTQPTDTLYITASPHFEDRRVLRGLLNDDAIIPPDMLFRPDDIYFGKAVYVKYQHAFGIHASSLDEYIAAIAVKNHYWRNITLGEIKTAVAKDENGTILYEVVYSSVIDNLINPQGISIASEIYWPRLIPLFLGPWFSSVIDIATSYEYIPIFNQNYYTSLTPGYARTLYPNSLYNMRNQVADELGQINDSRLLPLWMTSQQANGGTLGMTQAWVICYTKPGYAETIKNNINSMWTQPNGLPYALNMINFEIDRFTVDKSNTYNYDTDTSEWTSLPSADPTPNPLDSEDFYVLFPRQTILPDATQY